MAIAKKNSKIAIGEFYTWTNPDPKDIGGSAVEFLHALPGPTHIHITGEDSSRSRAVVTLLHGNEPSGLHAIYEILKRDIQATVDIHYFILNVDAARQAPGFIYRMLPQHKDLNRCFRPPYDESEPSLLAQSLLQKLLEFQPILWCDNFYG